jgi:hypothetical protein
MRCIDLITQAIDALPPDAIFTTRDMCHYGNRNAVDQAMFNLVHSEYIERLTGGVFMKFGAKRPSVLEIAQIKARAFGKELVTNGAEFVGEFEKLFTAITHPSKGDPARSKVSQRPQIRSEDSGRDYVFFVQGRSSSFQYGDVRIYLHGTTAKRTRGGETRPSQVKRALWQLRSAPAPHLYLALHSLSLDMLEELIKQTRWMPAWLSNAARSVLMPVRASPVGAA